MEESLRLINIYMYLILTIYLLSPFLSLLCTKGLHGHITTRLPSLLKYKYNGQLQFPVRAFAAVELKSYNAILAPPILQNKLTAVELKPKYLADLLQCTSKDRCAL